MPDATHSFCLPDFAGISAVYANKEDRMKKFDLRSQVEEVVHEIMVYKWLESEKKGHDIGIREATSEWIDRHYDDWFKYNSHRFYKDIRIK